jgi:hypothetical protein
MAMVSEAALASERKKTSGRKMRERIFLGIPLDDYA